MEAVSPNPRPGLSLGSEVSLADLPGIWGRRPSWQLPLRLLVAPLLVSLAVVFESLGFVLAVRPILAIAIANAGFSAVVAWGYRRADRRGSSRPGLDRILLGSEVLGDYVAMLLLLHFTGGVWSPLAPFFIFHVILAGIRFPGPAAYVFATWASLGTWLLYFVNAQGWITSHPIVFRRVALHASATGLEVLVLLLSLSATFFLAALLVHQIMAGVRARIGALSAAHDAIAAANRKLGGLYEIVRTLGRERHLQATLDRVVDELGTVVGDVAVAVGLLDEDGETLRFAAARGLPETVVSTAIEPARSPFHQRVLGGESVREGRVDLDTSHPLHAELGAAGIHSVLLTPLRTESRVLGTLGIYARDERRFEDLDVRFLELTAELVAIAVENARANEAIDALVLERTRFTLQVAHNLRAPLGASLGLLELFAAGRLGPLEPRQEEILERLVTRLRALDEMVAGLLEIGRSRDWGQEIVDVRVDLAEIARHVEQTFRGEAERRGVRFTVTVGPDLPLVQSGGDLVLRIVENLVSNAVKYTPVGGEVEAGFTCPVPGQVRILVRDTGIGIPAEEQGRLFEEFYRASNARKYTELGTGLGLAFVKQAVERHRGHLFLASAVGEGTLVVVDLYAERPARPSPLRLVEVEGRPITFAGASYDRS